MLAGKCDGYTCMLQMNPPRITKTTCNSAARASCFLVHFVAVTANYSVKLSNVTYDRTEDVDARRQIFLSISIL